MTFLMFLLQNSTRGQKTNDQTTELIVETLIGLDNKHVKIVCEVMAGTSLRRP